MVTDLPVKTQIVVSADYTQTNDYRIKDKNSPRLKEINESNYLVRINPFAHAPNLTKTPGILLYLY